MKRIDFLSKMISETFGSLTISLSTSDSLSTPSEISYDTTGTLIRDTSRNFSIKSMHNIRNLFSPLFNSNIKRVKIFHGQSCDCKDISVYHTNFKSFIISLFLEYTEVTANAAKVIENEITISDIGIICQCIIIPYIFKQLPFRSNPKCKGDDYFDDHIKEILKEVCNMLKIECIYKKEPTIEEIKEYLEYDIPDRGGLSKRDWDNITKTALSFDFQMKLRERSLPHYTYEKIIPIEEVGKNSSTKK